MKSIDIDLTAKGLDRSEIGKEMTGETGTEMPDRFDNVRLSKIASRLAEKFPETVSATNEAGSSGWLFKITNPKTGGTINYHCNKSLAGKNSRWYLNASYCPAKWFRGDNVYSHGTLSEKHDDAWPDMLAYPLTQKLPDMLREIKETALAKWLESDDRKISWNRCDIAFYTDEIDSKVNPLSLVNALYSVASSVVKTGVYEKDTEGRKLYIAENKGAAITLGYSVSEYYTTKLVNGKERKVVCGIRYVKRDSNNRAVFTFSMYDKVTEVAHNLEDRGNQLAISKVDLSSRIRCELQVYPTTFMFGRYREFKRILGLGEDAEIRDVHSCLKDLKVETAGMLVNEALRQLGVKYMLACRRPEYYMDRLGSVGVFESVIESTGIKADKDIVLDLLELWLDYDGPMPVQSMLKKDNKKIANKYTRTQLAKAYDFIEYGIGLDFTRIPAIALHEFVTAANNIVKSDKYLDYAKGGSSGVFIVNAAKEFAKIGKAI